MLLLVSVLIQITSVPAIPSPPAESLAAARLLWADHPLADDMKQMMIDNVVAEATEQALYRIGVQRRPKLSVTKAYVTKFNRLKPWIARRVPGDRGQLDVAVAECAMGEVARLLSPAEIDEVRRFMSTPVGRKFWQAAGLTYWLLAGCYRASVNLTATDADYRAASLRPPKAPRPPKPGTMVYG